jgi:hypothetical protein
MVEKSMKVVCNFASGAWYPKGQVRLCQTLKDTGYEGEFLVSQNPNDIPCPTHQEVPYAFKTHILMKALNLGYDMAIYCDSSIYAVKPWNPIWELIEKNGYFFEECGHLAGTWTKDSVLKRMGVTRDQAMSIPMFSAGFTGLNFKNEKAVEFLRQWHGYACDGDSFKGQWNNKNMAMSRDPRCQGHRHDMSVASIIAWKMGMPIGRGGTYLAYIGPGYGTPAETVVAHLCPA